jgi:hypothetical protein
MKQWEEYSNIPQDEKIGTIDALVINNDGERIAIEIITYNYGKEEMHEKLEVSRQLSCQRMIKIRA